MVHSSPDIRWIGRQQLLMASNMCVVANGVLTLLGAQVTEQNATGTCMPSYCHLYDLHHDKQYPTFKAACKWLGRRNEVHWYPAAEIVSQM